MTRDRLTIIVVALSVVWAPAGAQQRFTVDSIPAVDIRGLSPSGEVRFGLASGVTRLPSGTIAVADASTLSVRFFSSTGELTRSVGRAGQGPGEFRSIQWMGSCGTDSVYVWDGGQQRMSVIAAARGDVARQFRMPSTGGSAARPFTVTCSNRTFGWTSVPSVREPTGEEYIVRGATPLVLADADGKVIREVATVASGEMAAMRGAGFPRPLGKATTFAISGDRVFVGTADSAAIDEVLIDGTRRTIRLGLTPRPATSAHLDQAIEELVGMAPPPARARASESLRALRMPAVLPPYSGLLADPAGFVWVVESFPGDSITALRAFTAAGVAAGSVTIPRALRIFEIGADYILASWNDASDEPHVGMFRLRRR